MWTFTPVGCLNMHMSKDNKTLQQLETMRKQLQDRFAFVESNDDLPKQLGGSMILHVNAPPELTFHFLEFIFEVAYVDIMLEAGFKFLDDKTTWEYFVKSKNGILRIYDWKGYTVSVGSFGSLASAVDDKLKADAEYLKQLIEENIEKFDEYRQVFYKDHTEQYPFDNFMDAFASLTMLFGEAVEQMNKSRNYLETLILLVALLDTQLRYTVLLTRINKRKSKTIDPDFWELFQQPNNKYISERDIYKLAEQEVDFTNYDEALFFKRINELYDIRNRAVHRFAITNFQYRQSRIAVENYRDLVDILFSIIGELEQEQVRLGVGFIKAEDLDLSDREMRKEISRAVGSKIDPTILLPRAQEREPMFSDVYPEGYHPSLKEFMEQMEKDLKKKRKDKPH
jgi:hypothetical protein